MRRIGILSIVVGLVLSACAGRQPTERQPASFVDSRYTQFKTLVNAALDFRSEALQFALDKKLDQDGVDYVPTREEGEYLRSKGAEYLKIREQLLGLADEQSQWFQAGNLTKMTPHQGTRVSKIMRHKTRDLVGQVNSLNLDPADEEGRKQFFKIQMGLASALILMDNFLIAIEPYNSNSKLRYVLNYDSDERKALQQIANSYSSPERRHQIKRAIDFVDQVMTWRRKNRISTEPEEAHLYTIMQSSVWYLMVKNNSEGGVVTDAVANFWNRLRMKGKRGARVVSYGASMGFGNLVGLVETRKGYLYNMSESERNKLVSEMKPLDVLMEKTPFRLTDKMIPGHYGHVAIWLGTEEQLKELKVWDQIPAYFQEKIQQGHQVVEALRPGVELNTLEHFLNIDDLLVVRDRRPEITDEYRRQAILQAIDQIGKEYDFNFDVLTHERIVCSEIAYVVFRDIRWPTDEVLRRDSISPDNVVKLSVGQNRTFEPVILYYKGRRYHRDLPHSVDLLLKSEEASYAQFERFHGI